MCIQYALTTHVHVVMPINHHWKIVGMSTQASVGGK